MKIEALHQSKNREHKDKLPLKLENIWREM